MQPGMVLRFGFEGDAWGSGVIWGDGGGIEYVHTAFLPPPQKKNSQHRKERNKMSPLFCSWIVTPWAYRAGSRARLNGDHCLLCAKLKISPPFSGSVPG